MGREREKMGYLIAPYLIGEDPTDIPTVQQRLREMSYLGLRNWWIEPACWDIKGKLAGKSICELLGGTPGRVKLSIRSNRMKSCPPPHSRRGGA